MLISGIGDSATSAQWTPVQRELDDAARVCRYDRPGTGASAVPSRDGRGPQALVDELDAVVDHAAGSEPVVLVAHSFGGYLARLYAAEQPHRVRGIVFVEALDPSVGLVAGTGAARMQEVAMAGEQLDLAAVEGSAAAITRLPADPPLIVLTRGEQVTDAWIAGQENLAALSRRSERETVTNATHQLPSQVPQAVALAALRLLEEQE